ncbi:MAG: F0F1 ATP synthase subunit delta [bacterium]|nr:F0F1 ATP synthase subunit delta [bacterium]
MNYTPKIYAFAFCEATNNAKNNADIDRCIKNLLLLIKANRDQKKIKNILFDVEKLITQKMGGRLLSIESARELSPANEKMIKSLIKPTDIVEKRINSQLIAGVKININDELLLDGSFSTKIKNILNL